MDRPSTSNPSRFVRVLIVPLLETKSLTIGYAAGKASPHVVAHDLNVALDEGELVCLMGPNGAGKSTLMRTLAGMQPPLGGHALLSGEDVSGMTAQDRAHRIGVVLTDRVDAGHLDVRTLVGLGRYPYTDWLGRLGPDDLDKVSWAIRVVGATELADRPINELSDGERQKAMIARALAQDTELVLLDEPTAFLDLPRRVETIALLRRLARQTGKSILVTTHDLDLAVRNADRIWLMSNSRIEVGVPEALVLNGAFGRVFEREGILFDRHAGAFTVPTENLTPIVLHGTGLVGAWTTRALERVGFEVHPPAGPDITDTKVFIEGTEDHPFWRVEQSGHEDTFESLDSLLGYLSPSRLDSADRGRT